QDAFLTQTPNFLSIDPSFLSKCYKKARQDNRSVVLVHTHPFSEWPTFSHADDLGEAATLPALFSRIPEQSHGTLVLGKEGFSGRFYSDPERFTAITILETVGPRVARLRSDELSDTSETFDRNVRALGLRGQAILRGLKVGIVGVGGT